MPLDAASAAIVAQIDQVMSGIGSEVTDPVVARRLTAVPPKALADATPVGSVDNRTIPGPDGDALPIRLYRPVAAPAVRLPVMVFFHGGGWVIGDLEGHDDICRRLANRIGCVVVSVDYRLAPEHPFPAPLEDAYTALVWTADHAEELHVDPGRIVIAGDSAGGNLAAAATLLTRGRGGPEIAFQLLIYPVLDYNFERGSYLENGATGQVLTTRHMQWFWDQYADPSARKDAYAAPLRAADLSDLPPAHVISAQYDVLRDEAEEYAARLREAGVPVTCQRYPGFHGFFGYGALLPVARQAFEDAVRQVKAALTAPAPAATP